MYKNIPSTQSDLSAALSANLLNSVTLMHQQTVAIAQFDLKFYGICHIKFLFFYFFKFHLQYTYTVNLQMDTQLRNRKKSINRHTYTTAVIYVFLTFPEVPLFYHSIYYFV